MTGVDLRTVQELGGWRTLGMVQRYAHLGPAHLHAAVERLVTESRFSKAELGRSDTVELRRHFNDVEQRGTGVP
jgi:hypothetical protein